MNNIKKLNREALSVMIAKANELRDAAAAFEVEMRQTLDAIAMGDHDLDEIISDLIDNVDQMPTNIDYIIEAVEDLVEYKPKRAKKAKRPAPGTLVPTGRPGEFEVVDAFIDHFYIERRT
jgi:hypothetical protein